MIMMTTTNPISPPGNHPAIHSCVHLSRQAKFLRNKAHMYSWSKKTTPEELKQVEEEIIESHVDDTIG